MKNLATLPRPRPIASPIASIVREGLHRTPKSLPPVLFYDDAGSRLFERITELPEYYLTRTERAILDAHADEIIDACNLAEQPFHVVELGARARKRALLWSLRRRATLRAARRSGRPDVLPADDAPRLACLNAKAHRERRRGAADPRVACRGARAHRDPARQETRPVHREFDRQLRRPRRESRSSPTCARRLRRATSSSSAPIGRRAPTCLSRRTTTRRVSPPRSTRTSSSGSIAS